MFSRGMIVKCMTDIDPIYGVIEGKEYVINAVERHHGVEYIKVLGGDDRAHVLLASYFRVIP